MYPVLFSILAVCMALFAFFVRMKAMQKPASVKKILIPPIAMSTGFMMFLYPPVREITLFEVGEALTVGMLFSIILIKTSAFEIRGNDIFMKRSKAFPFILFGLLAVRLIFKLIFGIYFEYEVLAGMFFILAFGMIVPWRIAMYAKFKDMERQLQARNHTNQTELTVQT
ncbi:cytochrome c biogenesis protein CcdC [Salipaludibacillus agaradhaerens]|uniref:Cytochrome c biogenesis protein CcdC n=1 Tax=Salipaludibacillus agaradhaerens TaxID=76935 RepID=A0A9Q4FWH9_SALAG|nr:cytochrome c biogenesis protein CcdC [Salipaludibacillus agaradhaerens]MCR6096165.1 cytochrome c biogenesis protein CcdC [Salipaludibacillus agaradhaerens]MCR6114276.1 cytochrome c biogenesis protein CcdC [Salipaludibacillus agaradhaerens]UJW58036.1 cytochrome c biogenesis protein CcdC [Bacillus sp. A116_S68]